MTTFIAVCIPEFLSVFETERLVKELYNNEIDINTVVVNQVLFAEGNDCKMCNSRRKMQSKYIKEIFDLYEGFSITLLPLQQEEVRGVENLRVFSENLLNPREFN